MYTNARKQLHIDEQNGGGVLLRVDEAAGWILLIVGATRWTGQKSRGVIRQGDEVYREQNWTG